VLTEELKLKLSTTGRKSKKSHVWSVANQPTYFWSPEICRSTGSVVAKPPARSGGGDGDGDDREDDEFSGGVFHAAFVQWDAAF
jgi:hypothetical protein